jgi:hypothetical protein
LSPRKRSITIMIAAVLCKGTEVREGREEERWGKREAAEGAGESMREHKGITKPFYFELPMAAQHRLRG